MKAKKILLVDDEPDILEIIGYSLNKEGFTVVTAENGKVAIEVAIKENPDLIILDVMMPELDGMETCIQMRSIPSLKNTLIAFLTARGEDYSQIAGFEAGADDYITKPIKPKVLVSKIKAILRRNTVIETETLTTEAGGIFIDKERHSITKDGIEINVPRKEFALLSLLMSKPGKVFTRVEIFNKVWGTDVIVGNRTIDVHIRKLREKIGDNYIKTIKGIGYKFEF